MNESIFNLTNVTQEIAQEEIIPLSGTTSGVNALGLVVFSMCFGLIIGNMKEEGQALRDFFDSLNEAIMRLVAIIMWWVLLCEHGMHFIEFLSLYIKLHLMIVKQKTHHLQVPLLDSCPLKVCTNRHPLFDCWQNRGNE